MNNQTLVRGLFLAAIALAFGLGVLPLVLSSGAGAGARHAIGYATFFGTFTGTALTLVFVPVAFVVVTRLFSRNQPVPAAQAKPAANAPSAMGRPAT